MKKVWRFCIWLFFLVNCKVFLQVPVYKIDAGLTGSIAGYAVALGVWTGSEVALKNAYGDLEKNYAKLYNARLQNESRELMLLSYITASTLYAQSMIRGVERIMDNHKAMDKLLRFTQLTVLLGADDTNQGHLQEEMKYYKQQLTLINEVALILIAVKNPNPGKSLYIISTLLNKIGRVISRLGDIIYHLRLVYNILNGIAHFPKNPERINALNGLFGNLDNGFFMLNALQSAFGNLNLKE